MAKVVNFPNGIKVEVRDDGFTILSAAGVRTDFNAYGEPILENRPTPITFQHDFTDPIDYIDYDDFDDD